MERASSFYIPAGTLLSPGDLFDYAPYSRLQTPLKVARKPAFSLPKTYHISGELRELLDPAKDSFKPPLNFAPPGEETLATVKMARAIFLTWGSEVEDDERRGQLQKKDWLIAPVFPLSDLENVFVPQDGENPRIRMVQAIQEKKSPRFFPMEPYPDDEAGSGYYADFRKLSCIPASQLHQLSRKIHLSPQALDGFYHHLIWFFTRKRVFQQPYLCPECGKAVDLGMTFEGQPLDAEQD
jgi:hypothetical protein